MKLKKFVTYEKGFYQKNSQRSYQWGNTGKLLILKTKKIKTYEKRFHQNLS